MNAISLLLLLSFVSNSICGQSTSSEKPIYILFEKSRNAVLELGKSSYHEPEKRYPLDVSRSYIIKTFRFCDTCSDRSWGLAEFIFSFNPKDDYKSFEDIEIEEFYRKGRVLDEEWFDKTALEEIYKTLRGRKDIYLVDKGYLNDNKYVLIKVEYYWYEE